MKDTARIGLTAAAVIACASAASAATFTTTQTLSFGPARTAWAHTFSFKPFDTTLGTLVKVADILTERLAGSVTIVDTGSTTASFTAFLTDTAEKRFADGLTDDSETLSNTVSETLAPGGHSGALPLSGTSTVAATTTSGLADFESGPVLATASDIGALSFSSPDTGNATAVFTDTGQVIDRLVYTYTTKAPEPGTLALIGGAFAGLGLARRLRRKS